MDDQLRRLERQAVSGGYATRAQWKAALVRAGFPNPDEEGLTAPLTEAEAVQEDYDKTWWHSRRALRLDWDGEPKKGLYKAHHTWGHRGWGSKNSKRKTLRTHRNKKKKSKDHRIRRSRDVKTTDDNIIERRRKKRFGGREHRCGFDLYLNQQTGRWRFVYKYGVPDFDE